VDQELLDKQNIPFIRAMGCHYLRCTT